MIGTIHEHAGKVSEAARRRLREMPREPLLLADWRPALMMHFRVEPRWLQPVVPLELDVYDGSAWVSLVAFEMHAMRLRAGGAWTRWITAPLAAHPFLNVRTYVRHGDEVGIFFLAEYLSGRLAVLLGPRVYGLPYRYADNRYNVDDASGRMTGSVTATGEGRLLFHAAWDERRPLLPAADASPDAFLMERYAAWTQHGGTKRFFRIWHPPWPQTRADAVILDATLLDNASPWWDHAQYAFTNFSPGVRDVWISAPRRWSGEQHPTEAP